MRLAEREVGEGEAAVGGLAGQGQARQRRGQTVAGGQETLCTTAPWRYDGLQRNHAMRTVD
jgi:hypothetical protein